MTRTIPLAQAKARLSELVAEVGSEHQRVVVTVHGRPSTVLLSPADLDSMEETIAVLSDRVGMARLTTAESEIAAGLGESVEDLASAMARRHTGEV